MFFLQSSRFVASVSFAIFLKVSDLHFCSFLNFLIFWRLYVLIRSGFSCPSLFHLSLHSMTSHSSGSTRVLESKYFPTLTSYLLLFDSLQGSTIRKRKMYEEFLSKVSILGSCGLCWVINKYILLSIWASIVTCLLYLFVHAYMRVCM